MTSLDLTRRRFLNATAAVVGALALPGLTITNAAADEQLWRDPRTANGWPVLDKANEFRIEGSDQTVRLADGDTAVILLHIARRFNYEIDTLREGDVTGHSTDRHIAQGYESNYLSGTAIAIRPMHYPAGVGGLLYPNELAVVRDILADLDGTVAWGGDAAAPKESHFHIALPPQDRIQEVADRIRGWHRLG